MKDFISYIKLLFRKDKELYYNLKKIIGFYPDKIELYEQALLHKSIMHRNEKGKPINNERLEFLGDAVLSAVVGDIIYRHFPGKREGFLTNTRSKLVSRDTLGKLAQQMGITKLILSAGHSQSHNSYMGGNAFEALVGAIYLDKGYNQCIKFVEKKILDNLLDIEKVAYKEVNFKSKLLEWSQKNRIKLEYELVEQTKDENSSPIFVYQVVLETIKCEQAKGFSKKEAQQEASRLTLNKLRKNKAYQDAIFAAKSDRTKMEEEPVVCVPDLGENEKAAKPEPDETIKPESETKKENYAKPKTIKQQKKDPDKEEELSFDDVEIKIKGKSRDEIIAEAIEKAYNAG